MTISFILIVSCFTFYKNLLETIKWKNKNVSLMKKIGIEFPFFKKVVKDHETCTKSTLPIHHGGHSHTTIQVESREHKLVQELLVSLSKVSVFFF